MGDTADRNDLDGFMSSDEGKARLEEVRQMLLGRTIDEVSFSNEIWCIATTLHLDDGETFVVFQPSLDVEAIRGEFS